MVITLRRGRAIPYSSSCRCVCWIRHIISLDLRSNTISSQIPVLLTHFSSQSYVFIIHRCYGCSECPDTVHSSARVLRQQLMSCHFCDSRFEPHCSINFNRLTLFFCRRWNYSFVICLCTVLRRSHLNTGIMPSTNSYFC